MKRLTLFTAVVFILFSYSIAFADWVKITLESYPPATLPTVSTIVDVSDPADQLEMSRQAVLFALSSEGWNLESYGGVLTYREPPVWTGHLYWVAVPSDVSELFGYDKGSETYFFLYFHTDEIQGRPCHDTCESPDNYGVISGGMSGVCLQCTVPEWGAFTVETLPPPAVSGCIKIYGEGREGLEVHLNQKPKLKDITVTDSKGCFKFQDLLDPNAKFDLKVKCPEIQAPQ